MDRICRYLELKALLLSRLNPGQQQHRTNTPEGLPSPQLGKYRIEIGIIVP
jgi:hypothetical protein